MTTGEMNGTVSAECPGCKVSGGPALSSKWALILLWRAFGVSGPPPDEKSAGGRTGWVKVEERSEFPTGMMTVRQVCEMAGRRSDGRPVLSENTLKYRLSVGRWPFLRQGDGRRARFLVSEAVGRDIAVGERMRALGRPLAELAGVCGLKSAALSVQVGKSIRATDVGGRWYVDDTEFRRVVAYYGAMTRGEAARLVRRSTRYVDLLVEEDGMPYLVLRRGGERRYDRMTLLEHDQERRARPGAKPIRIRPARGGRTDRRN